MKAEETVVLFFGKSWTGKTARMLSFLERERRVVLIDPKCSQLVRLKGWDHLWPEYNPDDGLWSDSVVVDYLRGNLKGRFKVVVHVRDYFRENLELICLLLMTVKRLVLAIDELALFIPPGSAQAFPRYLTRVVVSGTHEGIVLMGTAQGASLVHKTAVRNAKRMLLYRTTEQNDVSLLSRYLPRDLAEKLRSLPDQVCIDWSDFRSAFIDQSLVGKLGKVLPGRRF